MISILLLLYHCFIIALGFDSVVINVGILMSAFMLEMFVESLIGIGIILFKMRE